MRLQQAVFERVTSANVNVTSPNLSKIGHLLPVATVTCVNPVSQAWARGNLLFDSGSQLSLVRESFAEKLGLNSDDVPLQLSKVAGHEELLESKMYRLQIRLNIDSFIHKVRAVSIPHISDPIRGINLDGYAENGRIFGLTDWTYLR